MSYCIINVVYSIDVITFDVVRLLLFTEYAADE